MVIIKVVRAAALFVLLLSRYQATHFELCAFRRGAIDYLTLPSE